MKEEQEYLDELYNSEWFLSRPEAVQKAIREYPPCYFYKDKAGYKVRLYSYSEDQDGNAGGVSYFVLPKDNPVTDSRLKYQLEDDGRRVFGAKLSDLTRLEFINES